jgi:hypothetical protein
LGDNWVKYEGRFKKNLQHGKGTLTLTNSEQIEGIWYKNKLSGEAFVRKSNNTVVNGLWT